MNERAQEVEANIEADAISRNQVAEKFGSNPDTWFTAWEFAQEFFPEKAPSTVPACISVLYRTGYLIKGEKDQRRPGKYGRSVNVWKLSGEQPKKQTRCPHCGSVKKSKDVVQAAEVA